jgi:hypothetical protein
MFRWSGECLDHPLREVRKLTDTVLGALSRELDALHAASGGVDCAVVHSVGTAVAEVLLGALRAAAGRTAWGWAWTMGCGTVRCFRRTGTGC